MTDLSYRPYRAGDDAFALAAYKASMGWALQSAFLAGADKEAIFRGQHDMETLRQDMDHPAIQRDVIMRKRKAIGRLFTEETEAGLRLVDMAFTVPDETHTLKAACMADLKSRAQEAAKPLSMAVHQRHPAFDWFAAQGFKTERIIGEVNRMVWHRVDG